MSDDDSGQISSIDLSGDKERRADLRAIYQATQNTRLDYRGRIWDTVKTNATVVAGLLVVTAAAYARREETNSVFLWYFGALVCLAGIVIGFWNFFNAREEQRHQLKHEVTIYQIEHLLGLHQKIAQDDRWPNAKSTYPYMFESKHFGEKFAALFEKSDPGDAPNVYAKTSSSRSGDPSFFWRFLIISVLLGILPVAAGGLLLFGPIVGSKNVRISDDIRGLRELSAVIERVERVDGDLHAAMTALTRKIAESSAAKRGTGEGPSGR